MESKLIKGLIPAHTECPFKRQCGAVHVKICHHMGKDHPREFSCGRARLIDKLISSGEFKDEEL
jgi:hypothetical protein